MVRTALTVGAWNTYAAWNSDALSAPASLASSTSRGSMSASLTMSAAVIGCPSNTPPLMTRCGFALAKSRRPFAAATGSPVTKAIADGPASCASRPSTPACLAAMAVSVFFFHGIACVSGEQPTQLLELRDGEPAVLGQHGGIGDAELLRGRRCGARGEVPHL